MDLERVSLDERYTRTQGRIFLTGIQALVRLPIGQSLRDRAAGLHTAGFISGYRGSPLAGLDRTLWSARSHLERHGLHFVPGVNEELGATAVWGSQQVNALKGAQFDGVFGLWYGKAPGVDRSGDALKHGNAAGTSRHGGVLVVAGDDHSCKSSTLPSQSEFALLDAGIPILNPSGVQEVLDYGLHAWALSRFSGLWVGMIALADTMDSAASVDAEIMRVAAVLPEIERPQGGLHFRIGLTPLQQEELLHRYRIPAALAYARANHLNRVVLDSPCARLGIVTTGKAHLDVLQALDDLGIDADAASELGLRILKVGMPWPLVRDDVREFARGLEEILVVEEKRSFVESQLREALYGAPSPPRIVGKSDEHGAELVPVTGDLSPARVARLIATRLPRSQRSARVDDRLAQITAREEALSSEALHARTPFYCSGCPHNRSTELPEGSRGLAGIGCHYMVQWMDRETETVSQMGGEGVQWIGQAPFTKESHVFANLGDGTYFHSGTLAIRAAIAAGVNITYKILYNDAVAMTGGQSIDGTLSVARMTHQLAAEGVARMVVVSDDPSQYEQSLAPGTGTHHRDELDAVQRSLRETPGCTVLIYDQTCAAELRRRRKRGLAPDPGKRLFINEAVCEGCGDCSAQSNCASIEPVETELGRKRRINQSSCNLDYSCANGLCPAFVAVRGASLHREASGIDEAALTRVPAPTASDLEQPWNILITGIGGTGVVTIGALLGTAAHLDGRAATSLDMTGLAQKGGAVTSQVRIAASASELHTPRIPIGKADALLACDLVVAAGRGELMRLDPEASESVVNTHLVPTAEFVLDNDVRYNGDELAERVASQSRLSHLFDATELAERMLGDAIATNSLMLGYAFQRGLIPLSFEALMRAIELNGVAVELNRRAFALGRLAAHDPEAVRAPDSAAPAPHTLEETIERRAQSLIAYQNDRVAERYRSLLERVREIEGDVAFGKTDLSSAVARGYHKLLAYKDEYEVARLYSDGEFRRRLAAEFDGDYRISLQLAPPLWARRDPHTGRPRKRSYGRWVFPALKVLTWLRFLRGTRFDPFGYSQDRRLERRLIADYEATIEKLLADLEPENYALAVEIADLPQEIRGFDQIKRASVGRARAREAVLLERYAKREQPVFDLPLLAAEHVEEST